MGRSKNNKDKQQPSPYPWNFVAETGVDTKKKTLFEIEHTPLPASRRILDANGKVVAEFEQDSKIGDKDLMLMLFAPEMYKLLKDVAPIVKNTRMSSTVLFELEKLISVIDGKGDENERAESEE